MGQSGITSNGDVVHLWIDPAAAALVAGGPSTVTVRLARYFAPLGRKCGLGFWCVSAYDLGSVTGLRHCVACFDFGMKSAFKLGGAWLCF